MLIDLKTKKLLVLPVIILIVICIVFVFFFFEFAFKETTGSSKMKFDQSTFYVGKWNGQLLLEDDDGVINILAITSKEQANYLKEKEGQLHIDVGDMITSDIVVHVGDKVTYHGDDYQLINLETTFTTDDLLKIQHMKDFRIRENNHILVSDKIGIIEFIDGRDRKDQHLFDYDSYTVAYPTIDKLKIELINNTDSVMNIKEIILDNKDLTYEDLKTTPFELQPNKKVNFDMMVEPTDKSAYDFWILSPKVVFDDGKEVYLYSTFHNNYEISTETIENIIKRKSKK